MLEMFVFVSGYVFGYQVRTKGGSKLQAKALFWGKFKRLMIPCMAFSLLYILLFGDIGQPIKKTLYDMLNGAGHMWFLPMLFWCFVGVWLIEKQRLQPKWVLPLLLLASIVSFVPLPFRMSMAMYYMLFFYVGYILQKENVLLVRFYTFKHCVATTVAFFVLFPTLTLLADNLGNLTGGGNLIDNQLITKAAIISLSKLMQIIYASVGLWMLLVWIGYCEIIHQKPLPQWVVKSSNLCLGVYLFQQFILMALYKHTNLAFVFGPYWLPWCGFVIALIGSLLLTYLFRLTVIGRSIIG